jgi:hypothetical protein
MTETDLCVNKPQSIPVIFELPCTFGVLLVLDVKYHVTKALPLFQR